MSDNLQLWNAVRMIDPAFTKAITGRDYKGTSPNFTKLIEMATAQFGPCGVGFGWDVDDEKYVELGVIGDGPARELLHVVRVRFWYEHTGGRGEVVQMGQTKLMYVTKSGGVRVDEDAPKKSITDAVTKCMACIGFAADIHLGRYDDNKYVEAVAEKFEAERRASDPREITRALAAKVDALSLEGCDAEAFSKAHEDDWRVINDAQRKYLTDRIAERGARISQAPLEGAAHGERIKAAILSAKTARAIETILNVSEADAIAAMPPKWAAKLRSLGEDRTSELAGGDNPYATAAE